MTTVRVPSESTPGAEYRVDVRDGHAVCDCPAGAMGRRCKHAEAALKEEHMNEDQEPIEGEIDDSRALVASDGTPLPLPVHLEERTLPTRGELEIISTIARTVIGAKGHAVPSSIDTPAKAAAVMLAGWELGLKPMTALRHVFVVNGRTEPDGSAMMGLVKAGDSTAAFTFHEYTDKACDVSLHRSGHLVARCEYTEKDAEASGQLKKGGPWTQYRRDMLAWSAVKRVCRLGAPDLINAIPSVDVRNAAAMFPEPIEAVAIGETGRTLEEERRAQASLDRQNAAYARRRDPEPEAEPDPLAQTPEEIAEIEAQQAALLPPDPAGKAHP